MMKEYSKEYKNRKVYTVHQKEEKARGQKRCRPAVFLALLLILSLTYALPTMAANRVPDMEINVALQEDGSAYIMQTWTTDTDEGTEFYLGCHDNGYLSITDFAVSDVNGSYTWVDDWDINASFEEKAGKCGIVETDEGVELCWGISQYGENCYMIEYTLHDLVGSYTDADGFLYRFVDEMSFFPTDVVLAIYDQNETPLTEDNCRIWAFGYDGEIQFIDGVVGAWSGSPLESGQHMTLMVALDKGVLSPQRTVEESFDTVIERALEGSDYDADAAFEDGADTEITGSDLLISFLFLVFTGGLIAAVLIAFTKLRAAKLNRQMQNVEYFRDAPNNGDLNVTYELGRSCDLCREDVLLGAYLLRLISDGSLEPQGDENDPKKLTLRLVRPPHGDNTYDDAFYTILEAAAGADGVLQSAELEKYSNKNAKPLSRFFDSCVRGARQTLIRGGCFKGAVCNSQKDLTKAGRRQLDEILGLKRFLLDFSLIHERGIKETVIWQDYMVYAMLLGIADKVLPQIRALYPDALPQIQHYERYMRYAGSYNAILYRAYREEQHRYQASRSAGSGGHASLGGGGGFSGGGGGGTR